MKETGEKSLLLAHKSNISSQNRCLCVILYQINGDENNFFINFESLSLEITFHACPGYITLNHGRVFCYLIVFLHGVY